MTRRRLSLALVVAAVLSDALVIGQTRQTQTTVVRGRVVEFAAASPAVERAKINLYSLTDPAVMFSAVSAEDGTFGFDAIPTGRYSLRASKPGWLDGSYGSRRIGLPGRPLVVSTQPITEVVLQMARGAVIDGLVLDASGQPIPGSEVRVLRYVEGVGVENGIGVGISANRLTDDRGAFRVYGLPPGNFIVAASPARIGADTGAAPRQLSAADFTNSPTSNGSPKEPMGVEFATVFYPSATDIASALPIRIEAGEVRTNVTLSIRLVRVVTIRGLLRSTDGFPLDAALATVTLVSELNDKGVGTPRTAPISREGEFAFTGVAPGHYSILARVVPGRMQGIQIRPGDLAAARYGSVDVVVGQRDVVSDVALSPGGAVKGTIVPPSAGSGVNLSTASVRLAPLDPSTVMPVVASSSSGDFQFVGVPPGRYRVVVAPPVSVEADWFLETIQVQGKDLIDGELRIASASVVDGVVVKLTKDPAQIQGRLLTPSGISAAQYSVIAFPVDRSLWRNSPQRLSQVRPGGDGRFLIRGLPPGEYNLAVVAAQEELETLLPSLLEELIGGAVKVKLAAGQHVTQDLQIVGVPSGGHRFWP